jgi:hypothetical protein
LKPLARLGLGVWLVTLVDFGGFLNLPEKRLFWPLAPGLPPVRWRFREKRLPVAVSVVSEPG